MSASRPACTRGCRVLTLPSRHSGNPVRSSTAWTGSPAADIVAADRKSTRLNSSHTEIYTLSLHDALPILHPRVQGLDPAVQAFREPGQVLDRLDWQPGGRYRRRRGSGGHDRDPGVVQAACQVGEPALVMHADQRPADRHLAHRPILTFLPCTDHPCRTIRPTVSTTRRRSVTFIRSCRVSSSSSSATGTAAWAITGPLSTPASTRNRVHPVTFTPYSRASRAACMPGNDGSNAACVLTKRPPNAARNWLPTSFMKPAETIRSGANSRHALVSARSQASRSG